MGISLDEETVKERQSRVVKAGEKWENVMLYLSEKSQEQI